MHRLKPKIYKHPSRSEEDTNPKTIPLDKLVQTIDPKVLSYYLSQVSSFLLNTKKDLWFPQISADLDALLVRMIRDEQNLRSLLEVLDESSREHAEIILVTLRENEEIYKLVHSYDSSKSNKNTLVYRKVFAAKAPESIADQPLKMGPPKSPPATEDPSIACKPPTPPPKPGQNSQTPEFKIQWYRATMHFLTVTEIDHMEYPDMSIEEAEMVASCFASPEAGQYGLKPLIEAVMVCKESYEIRVSFVHLASSKVRLVVEKVPLNNNIADRDLEFEADTLKTQKNYLKKKHLVQRLDTTFTRTALQMILDFIQTETEASIVFKNANEEQSAFLQSACAMAKSKKMHGVFDESCQGLLKKIQRVIANGQKYELRIDVAKMERETKLRTVSLIKQPKEYNPPINRAHLPSTSTSYPQPPAQSQSIDNVKTTDNTQTNYQPTPSCSHIKKAPITDGIKPKSIDNLIENVKSISNSIAFENFKSTTCQSRGTNRPDTPTIDHGRIMKPMITEEAEITIYSTTLNNTPAALSAKIIDKSPAAVVTKTADATIIENTKAVDAPKRIAPTPIDYVKAIDQARTISKTQNQPKETSKLDNKEKSGVKYYMKLPVADKGRSSRTVDIGEGTSTDGRVRGIDKEEARVPTELSDGRPMPLRKAKLIEAMSVPMESDRAMRMMRQMGWEGGPLGTRGEGITEPIMPALHIASGAGLGHVKPKKEQPKTNNFRWDILNSILQLIRGQPLKKTVLYPNQVSKRERGFLLNAVRALTRRSNLEMGDPVLAGVVKLVAEELEKEPRLQVAAVLHDDRRSITLSKNDVQKYIPTPVPTPEPQGPPAEAVCPIVAKLCRTTHVSVETATAVGLELGSGSVKSAKGLGHRVLMLSKMLDLVRGTKYHLPLTFEYALTLKQVHFIKEVIASINLHGKISYGIYENHLIALILAAVGEYVLIAEFGSTHRKETKGPYTSLTFKKRPPHKRPPNPAKELTEIALNNNNREMANNNKPDMAHVKFEVINDRAKIASGSKCKKVTNNVTSNSANVKCDSSVVDTDEAIIISDDDSTDTEGNYEMCGEEHAKELVVRDSSAESKQESVASTNEDAQTSNADGDGKVIKTDDESANAFSARSDSVINRKKTKCILPKYVCIAPDSYPIEEVDFDMILAFQNNVCDRIDEAEDKKPLIECLGLKNGAIIYGCHNEEGIYLVEGVAMNMDLKTTNITNLYKDKKKYKINARINSYLDYDLKKLLRKLEEYNEGLKTDLWTVTDVKKNKGNIEMIIEVDGSSFEYISQRGFGLFAGVDKIRFCVVWN